MGMYGERLGRGVTREAARKYETSVTERARRERWQASGCARVVSRKYGTVVVPHGSNFAALLNAAEHIGADVIDKDRLLWEADGEAVVINAVRKACSGWAKEWERAVWNALEGVDLHKEEAGR